MSKAYSIDMEQLEALISYACRYVIGRATYAPHEFMRIVEPMLSDISSSCLNLLYRDIVSLGRAWGYGMDIDRRHWELFLEKLKEELKRREEIE